MDPDKIQSCLHLIRRLALLLYLTKLYGPGHPLVKAELPQVLSEIEKNTLKKSSLIFAIRGNMTLFNGEELEVRDGLSRQFIHALDLLKLGSLDVEPGLTLNELEALMLLLHNVAKLSGDEQVRSFLDEHKVKHVIPRSATYKLVQEDEQIVKEGAAVDIDKLSPELIKSFSSDLNQGLIRDNTLAHNPDFLCRVFTDLTKTINTPDELLKVIWVIGEYLIDEISTAREMEVNRKVLEQLKDHLLAQWEQRENKEQWKKTTEESIVKIIATLQLKGLLLLYKKHKKELEVVSKKIKSLIGNIPEESRLYQKTKEELKQIGIPELDAGLFV